MTLAIPHRGILLLLLAWVSVVPCRGDDAARQTPGVDFANTQSIDSAIERLGAEAFRQREAATRELLLRGSTAIPKLEQALPSAKGEVRYRIRTILSVQRRAADATTRRAAEQALVRISGGKDPISATWARAQLAPAGAPLQAPVAIDSPIEKRG